MALWEKTQQFPPDSPAMQKVRTIYGADFPIEVRHCLAHFIEEKFWADLQVYHDNHTLETYVGNLVNQLIQEIEAKAQRTNATEKPEFFLIKMKLGEAANMFKQKYSTNPMVLFNYIRQCLSMEMQLLQEAGLVDSPGPGTSAAHILIEPGHDVTVQLREAHRLTQFIGEELLRLEQEQETLEIQHHEAVKSYLVNHQKVPMKPQMVGVPQDANYAAYISQKELVDQNLSLRVAKVLEVRLEIIDHMRTVAQQLARLQSKVIDEDLLVWKRNQQLSGNGVPFANNLDALEAWFASLAEILWENRKHIKCLERLKEKTALNHQTPDMLPQLMAENTQLLSSLVTSSFVIEKQPPQVMKTNTRFQTTIRLLIGGILNVHMNPPQVKATIISETQANLLLKNDKKGCEGSGEILNNTGVMEFQQSSKQLSVSFRNMQLKRIKRAEKKGTESVMDEKFSVLFQSHFSVGNGELVFNVWTLSLPVVVIVHGNQEPHAWATVTWDNAFSEPNRAPFQVPDKVAWNKMKETLSQKFKSQTGRELTESNLRFLADKAFRDTYNENGNSMVTWSQFCKEPLPDRNFTFWEWFFAIMKLTREHLRGPWIDGAIIGFVKKKQAEDLLRECQCGTFLLRFSDSELGGITIAWVTNSAVNPESQDVFSLQPFTAKDFTVRSLADRIADLNHLINLYPNTPKENYFQKYYTPITDQHQAVNGYVKPCLVTQVPGFNGQGSTPQHFMSPVRDTPSVASSYAGSVATTATGAHGSQMAGMDYLDFDDSSYPGIDININEFMGYK